MSKKQTLSIVIPMHNEEGYLKACLDAIADQTVKPDEVIVVDNNSTDGSVKVAKQYPFVKVVSEKRQSVLYARTTGFNAAKSDLIGRIDADTRLSPNWVETALRLFEDQSVMAITGPTNIYDMPFSSRNRALDHLFKGSLYKYAKRFPFLSGNNMAIRKSAWQKIEPKLCEDKTIHEDLDIAIHLYKNNLKIIYSAELFASMSSRRYDDSPSSLRRYIKMTDNAFDKHNLKTVGVHVSAFGYTLGYVLLWPLRRSYNPETGRRHIRQFINGNPPRKNPMDS